MFIRANVFDSYEEVLHRWGGRDGRRGESDQRCVVTQPRRAASPSCKRAFVLQRAPLLTNARIERSSLHRFDPYSRPFDLAAL